MRNKFEDGADLKIRLSLAFITIVAMIVLAGTYQGNMVRGAANGPTPRVTSITQVTNDGYPKENLLADDSSVYVTEMPSANRVVTRLSMPGPGRSVVQSPFLSLEALDLSPDHSKLLVSSKSRSGENEFWMLPLQAGSPQRLGDLAGRDASWSADGKQLAFAKGPILNIANGDGSQAHTLYTATGSVFAVRFSPDGKRIRFTVSNTEQNTTELWEVGTDGANPHAMLADWPYKKAACCGTWTADGKYYIFQATQVYPNTDLRVTNLWALNEANTTAGPAQITDGPMSFGYASPSGDNSKLWAIGVQPHVQVVKYEAAKKRYVPLINGLSATDVNFSDDGKWISYVSVPEGALWRAKADGSDRLQLTSGAERTGLPRWSPDGKQIAFVAMKPGESWKLYVVSRDGGTPQPVLEGGSSQIDANWSSDGQKLMFGAFNHEHDGMNIRILDFKTHTVTVVPGSDGLFSPRWSPNEQYIAAMSPDGTKLMLFDFHTQKWTTWKEESLGTVNYPVWSADSKYVYFDDLVNGSEAIRRLKVGSMDNETAFEIEPLDRYPGQFGAWSGRAPDGSWMFVKDRSTQEVYQLSMELP